MRSHWLGPHPCIGQSAARRPSSPLRINVLAHARAVSRKPHRHPSRCQILSAGSFARLGSLTRNSLRFSWSLSEMRPLRLLRASECVARRAAPGSCSALRAQPRRGLDRAEQSIREHGTHNFLWAEECNFMPPQPSKSGQGGLRGFPTGWFYRGASRDNQALLVSHGVSRDNQVRLANQAWPLVNPVSLVTSNLSHTNT